MKVVAAESWLDMPSKVWPAQEGPNGQPLDQLRRVDVENIVDPVNYAFTGNMVADSGARGEIGSNLDEAHRRIAQRLVGNPLYQRVVVVAPDGASQLVIH